VSWGVGVAIRVTPLSLADSPLLHITPPSPGSGLAARASLALPPPPHLPPVLPSPFIPASQVRPPIMLSGNASSAAAAAAAGGRGARR